jgi:hypothetical protein
MNDQNSVKVLAKTIYAHRGGVRWLDIAPPQTNFKTLVNKNAIKHEIGSPTPTPGNFS